MINKINGSVTKTIEVEIIPKKKKTLANFLKNIKKVSNSSINLHPKGIGKGYEKYQAFSQEMIGGVNAKIGYVSNFRNSGKEAILVHGTKNGRVALYSHSFENRKEFTVKDFISHIKNAHSIDLKEKNKEPLHILSCFGVSNGVYQAFSNELMRKVIGYGDGNAILTSGNLNDHFNKKTSIKSVIGDVEKDQHKDLKFTKASLHKFIPQAPKN